MDSTLKLLQKYVYHRKKSQIELLNYETNYYLCRKETCQTIVLVVSSNPYWFPEGSYCDAW